MGLRQQKFSGMVMSVLILEDILAIVMMVMLSAVARGANPDGGQMIGSLLRITFFLVLWFVVGIALVPWLLRSARRLITDEMLLVVALGLCCLMAVVSTHVGFSSAFGAFVMGSIFAETVEADRIIKLVEPVKNFFGAVFFVSVGMLVEPEVLVTYALPIVAIVMTILFGQAIFGSLGYLLSGQSLKNAIKCGFSMAQIGEFAFIIASLGLSLGVIGDFLYPVVVAVSVITTFLTPYMIRFAAPFYTFLESHLDTRVISMLNNITLSRPNDKKNESNWRSLLRQMGINTAVYSILSIAVIFLMLTFVHPFIIHLVPRWPLLANIICGLLTVLCMSPFLRAMVMKKNHSEEFKALWRSSRINHLPLLFTILVRMVIAGGFVFYVCHHLTHFANALIIMIALVVVVVMILSRSLKKSSIRLERLFVLNLRSRDIAAQVRGQRRPLYEGHLLDRDVHMSDFVIPSDSLWAGKTLAQLNLGKTYGIHVSSILRANRRINIPDGNTVVFPLDSLQVIGSDEQLSAFSSALQSAVYNDDPDIEKREIKLRQIILSASSPFVGKTIVESRIRADYNCMIVGIEEGHEHLSQVNPHRRLEHGDILWVVGEVSDLDRLS